MKFIRLLIKTCFRNKIFFRSNHSQSSLILRVTTAVEENNLKFCFNNASSLGTEAPKNQHVSTVLSVIKLKFALLRQRQEMRQLVIQKYSSTANVAVEDAKEDYDVYLYEGSNIIDERTLNIDAWPKASILKIGDSTYTVHFNTPLVKSISLPEYIIRGGYIRPHILLECASIEDSVFTWFRSVKSDVGLNNNSMIDWVKVCEGLIYSVTSEDVGCYLKVVCSPREGSEIGLESTAISMNVVESQPEIFPFEERVINIKSDGDSAGFRCVSYNTLARMYVEKRKFPYSSVKARDIYYRKQLLLRELLGYSSDIICLQEVEERTFENDYLPVLKQSGYDGFYQRKGGVRYEGLATFFRSPKFNVQFYEGILLNEIIKEKGIFSDLLTKVSGNFKDMSKLLAQDTALQIVLLENKENPVNKILVANTHLYSHKDNPEVRLIQVALCIYYLDHLLKNIVAESPGVLFCGDFNSLPNSEAYEFVTSGSYHCCPSWKSANLNVSEDSTLRHNLNLESACGTPTYTNYTAAFQGCLDYIFYSKNILDVTDIVPMPSHETVTSQVGLPSEYFPSDHIALVCTLKWKK